MAGIPFFTKSYEAARSWTRLVIARENWPGITFVSGPGLKRKVEENSAKGDDGASLKDNGRELAKINIDNTIWTAEHFDEVQRLLPLIEPNRDGGPRSPIEVYHPLLSLLGIDTIYIKQIQVPGYDLRKGTLKIRMVATRWAPAPKPVVKGAGSGGSNKNDDVNDDYAAYENLMAMQQVAAAIGDEAAVESLQNAIDNLNL